MEHLIKPSGVSAVIIAIAGAIGYYLFPDETHSPFAKWFLYPFSLALSVCFLLVPACWFGNKLAQSLMGRLPPDRFKDAEPIRFDRSPTEDSENRKA